MSKIACKVPVEAKLTSATRRLGRLLDNPAIQMRKWYEPIARQWLETQFRGMGEIRLIVDGTRVVFENQSLMVALAYRKKVIPIAWAWVKQIRRHGGAVKHLVLLAFIQMLLLK